MTKHLIIPDSHAHPDYNNARFKWLGRAVVDIKPDVVVMLGDWADMPSLCSYDKGTKGYEGRRYKKDINSAIGAQELFFNEIKRQKKKLPRFIMLHGNHEHRISRAINVDHNLLDGVISLDDLEYSYFGWEEIPYDGDTPGRVLVHGVLYSHYFTSGVLGRPISGLHPAYQLLAKQYTSCTQGHIHTTDYCIRGNGNGKHIHGLVGGCYIDYRADFAGVANNLWWRGIIVKNRVEDGTYDPQWIGIDRLKANYK